MLAALPGQLRGGTLSSYASILLDDIKIWEGVPGEYSALVVPLPEPTLSLSIKEKSNACAGLLAAGSNPRLSASALAALPGQLRWRKLSSYTSMLGDV